MFANFARFVEAPIPLDINVRAGSENSQTDKNFNVSRYSRRTRQLVPRPGPQHRQPRRAPDPDRPGSEPADG